MPGAYRVEIDAKAIRVLISRLHFRFDDRSIGILGQGIERGARIVQARAVRNVTGYPVIYQGGAFRVMVRTGTLRGAIDVQWPYGSLLIARVFVNGTHMTPPSVAGGWVGKPIPVSDYAGAIEWGHDEIDLKQHMLGKVVPFFGARAQNPRGPYAAGGLEPVTPGVAGYGAYFTSEELNKRLAAKEKPPMYFRKQGGKAAYRGGRRGGSSYFISFRTVGKKGWIIPKAAPRPFMRAAAEGTKDQVRRTVADAAVQAIRSGMK